MNQVNQRHDFLAVARVAQHVWVAAAFVFVWLHFSVAREYQSWVIYSLYFLAIAGVALRYLTGIRHGHERWHRVLFDALSILFIALGVNQTGGILSELWLLYFIFVIAETLAASARGVVVTDAAAILSYVVATWPVQPSQQYVELLTTRVFFLVLVASIARTIAQNESRRQADLAALREALSVSEERRRLARDLHDGIGHILTRVILSLEVARRQYAAEPEAAETVAQQTTALRGAMEEMRQIVATLRTDTGVFDIRTALRAMAAELGESESLHLRLELPEEALPLSPHRQYHLSRVMQEAITNCLRHAGVDEAFVSIRVEEAPVGPDRVVAVVEDHGRGFDPEHLEGRSRHGLQGMSERLVPYGGKVSVTSRPGRGTRVMAELPADAAQ